MVASDYFPVHAHGEKSVLDAIGSVSQMVRTTVKNGHPALALTDHGTMADVIRLYKECRKAGILPFPGSELYVVTDVNDPVGRENRFHLGMLALDFDGYKAMIKLSSRSHQRDRFHRKPLVDFGDLADMYESGVTEHVAITTGCYFGLVVQTLVHKGYEAALAMTRMLNGWFPNTYVELQKHGITRQEGVKYSEEEVADALLDIADDLGLPVVLGQDSHYCDASHQPVHDLMKEICYFGAGEDTKFPGGPFHLAQTGWLRDQWPKKAWARIEEGHGDLLDNHRLILPALENYQFHVPSVSKKPNTELARSCRKALSELLIPEGHTLKEYSDQLEFELGVIKKMGFANYFLLVGELCDWMRQEGIIYNARGSVNGCLVAYLMNITTIDPIYWDTDFGRFLSIDRKKPPDIDLDIESGKRALAIAHMRRKFPTLVPIGTYGRIGITETEDGEDKGSVYVQYAAAKRKKEGSYNGIEARDRPLLEALATQPVRKSLGVHAGGYVLGTDSLPVSDYLALALVASSDTTVTQAPMEDVEEVGFMKLDMLGLRALETLNTALVNIGYQPNEWGWIPWDDPQACKVLRSGYTDGIFQFEGWSTRKGGKEMGVRSTMDAIRCLALYRPALMGGGQKDMYLANRGKPRDKRPYLLHPYFDPILDVTDGVPVFQEQVMKIMTSLDMEFEDWNDLMKAVKASNDKIDEYAKGIMARVRPIFMKLALKKGLKMGAAQKVWEAIVGFTDYGFNRAHATSYGVMAYRSAYMKAHMPYEYMHACLATWAGHKEKEPMFVNEIRRLGFKTAKPCVNRSQEVWTMDSPGVFRKGLTSIHGIGGNVAEAIVKMRPAEGFTDMPEFVELMPAVPVSGGKSYRKDGTLNGKMAILRDANALACLDIHP